MKSQMKSADKSGAALVLIIGGDESESGTVTIRDLRGDTGQETVDRVAVVAVVATRLS
jgi:histidyl-tRNA synthetase